MAAINNTESVELIEPLETSFHELDEEKPLCHTCGKAMKSRKTLQLHTKIHEGSQKHGCSSCPKKYNKKIDLENHIRSRHGGDLLTCKRCQKYFVNKSCFTKHVKSCGIPGQHNIFPLRCDTCGLRFRKKCELKIHQEAKHDNIASFSCAKCGCRYRWRSSLFYHKQKCASIHV